MLYIDPTKRINAKEALSHPFFITSNSNIFYDSIPKEKSLEYIKNLLSYRINSRFQEMVLAYIIHNMPKPKDAKNAIKLFKLFNEQGDGKLTKDELKNALLNFVTEDYLNNIDDIFIILDGDTSRCNIPLLCRYSNASNSSIVNLFFVSFDNS